MILNCNYFDYDTIIKMQKYTTGIKLWLWVIRNCNICEPQVKPMDAICDLFGLFLVKLERLCTNARRKINDGLQKNNCCLSLVKDKINMPGMAEICVILFKLARVILIILIIKAIPINCSTWIQGSSPQINSNHH